MIHCVIKLEIYTVEHKSYGDSVQTIFTDKKLRDYDNYEDVEADVRKLAAAASKTCKGNQEFNIRVCFTANENWCIATYYSYVAPINRHLTKGYCQQYKDWNTVISNYQKYVGNTQQQKSKYNLITIDTKRFKSNNTYKVKCLKELLLKNKNKTFKLEEPVSNDWNGDIVGFTCYNDKIFINCYWQGDSTDGNKRVLFDSDEIKFYAEEQTRLGIRKFHVNFMRHEIMEAIDNLFIQLGII